MLQFGNSNKVHPPQLTNTSFWGIEFIVIASSQQLSNMFPHFSNIFSAIFKVHCLDGLPCYCRIATFAMENEPKGDFSMAQGTARLQSGEAYLYLVPCSNQCPSRVCCTSVEHIISHKNIFHDFTTNISQWAVLIHKYSRLAWIGIFVSSDTDIFLFQILSLFLSLVLVLYYMVWLRVTIINLGINYIVWKYLKPKVKVTI